MEPGTYETDTSGMVRVHRVVEEVIGLGSGYAAEASELDQVDAVASFCKNVLEYLRVHHAAEDELLYPRLEERCADQVQTVRHVWRQHELLDEPTEAAGAAVTGWRDGPSVENTAALDEALSSVSNVLALHCRDEEELILPLASRYLSQAEWVEMLAHEGRNFRADKSWLMLGLVMERSDESQRAALLARMPEARRTLWVNRWRFEFQEFMKDVRGN